jgi:hypothetical protein
MSDHSSPEARANGGLPPEALRVQIDSPPSLASASSWRATVGTLRVNRERRVERETGIEPATNSLGSCDSTTELLPPTRLASAALSPLRRAGPPERRSECSPSQTYILPCRSGRAERHPNAHTTRAGDPAEAPTSVINMARLKVPPYLRATPRPAVMSESRGAPGLVGVAAMRPSLYQRRSNPTPT